MRHQAMHYFFKVLLIVIPISLFFAFDQAKDTYLYPVDVFRSITGSFGEPRSNHFHSGMDIRIGGRIGTPIKASRGGYVYRINVSPFGFGKALYLRHSDGQYSVYAHLNAFSPKVERLVHRRQVEGKQAEIQLFLRPEEVPVKKGEIIAYGGNSGSSRGPHLHFEIRDPQERILNPMHYFEDDLADNIAPIIQELMLIPLSPSTHIEGLYAPFRQAPLRQNQVYFLPQVVKIKGPVGLAYRAYDLLNSARFHCGINYVRLLLDDRPIYRLNLDRFAFSETRYLNHHIDYAIYQNEGKRFEKAFVDEGNRFSAYSPIQNNGAILLQDDKRHTLRLELEDFHGNKSIFRMQVQRENAPGMEPANMTFSTQPHIHTEVYRKVLSLVVDCPSPEMLQEGLTVTNVFGTDIILKPSYAKGDKLQFLYPMDSLLFPSAVLDHTDSLRRSFSFQHMIAANEETDFRNEHLQLNFPARAVYQDTYLEISSSPALAQTLSKVFHIGRAEIPLHKYVSFSFRLPPGVSPQYTYIAYRDDEGEWSFQGNRQDKPGYISARVRDFGSFALLEDRVGPEIYPHSFRNQQSLKRSPTHIRLSIKDEQSGVASKSIQASLDGNWIPFYYDYKNDQVVYKLPIPLSAGTHQLLVSAKDEVGNYASQTFQFNIRQ